MMSLFKSFDLFFFEKSLLFVILFLILLSGKYFFVSSISGAFQVLMNSLSKFFHSLKPKSFNKFSMSIFLSVFLIIFFLNFLSVFSFTFPITSQFGVIFSVSILNWLSGFLFMLYFNSKYLASHMIPEGAPIFLSVFLFLIELISTIIRPLTLTVRLVANILAGHLLLILLSKLVFYVSWVFFFYVALNIVEILVSLIQAYIFSTMIVLYFAEVN